MSKEDGLKKIAKVKTLSEFAQKGELMFLKQALCGFSCCLCLAELGCTVTHLALAWVAKQPGTSTVILGATKPEQIIDNLKALEVIPKLTDEVLEKIDQILENKPAPPVSAIGS